MKKLITLSIVAFTLLIAPLAQAKNKKIGLGIIIGAPTGISGNYRLGGARSIDAALSFDFGDNSKINLHSTYIWHKPDSIYLDEHPFGWYYGLGARIKTQEDKNQVQETLFGARGSIGVNIPFEYRRFDVFAEAAVTLDIITKTSVGIDAAIGGRVYF